MARERPPLRRSRAEADALTLQVLDLFFRQKKKPSQIVGHFARQGIGLSRAQVHHYLLRGRDQGFVRLVAPSNNQLHDQIVEAFELRQHTVSVVDVPSDAFSSAEYVAEKSASVVLDLIREVERVDPTRHVGLGMGTGRFSLTVTRSLNRLLHSEKPLSRRLRLIALTPAAPIERPQYCPVSFFNLIHDHFVEQRVGMFTEPMMKAGDFERMRDSTDDRSHFGFTHAARHKADIDVVFTGLGDPGQKFDLYRSFLFDSGRDDVDAWIREKGILGNVQYRPFTAEGPYRESPDEMRPVTLLEFDDFRRLAEQKFKYVILAVRKSEHGESRAATLRALLNKKATHLRAFSHLVLDSETAKELIELERREAGPPA